MKLKDGVVLAGLSIKMRPLLMIADRVWKAHGQELVITAGLDGAHSAGSLHYYGFAIDCRTRYFDAATAQKVFEEMRRLLPVEYDVVLESSHMHMEYDPKS